MSWECSHCNVENELNGMNFSNCRECKNSHLKNGWVCGICTLVNSKGNTSCSACGSLPSTKASSQIGPEPESQSSLSLEEQTIEDSLKWVCEKCTLENPFASSVCKVCESHLPSPKRKDLNRQREIKVQAIEILEREKVLKEKQERIKLERERIENARLERINQERKETDGRPLQEGSLEKEQQLLENEWRQRDLLERTKLERERLEKERLERDRIDRVRLERERVKKEREEILEKERLQKEKFEREKFERDSRLDRERLERERERLEQELQRERLEREKLEKERLERDQLEKERLQIEVLEKERREREQKEELERLEKEIIERERAKRLQEKEEEEEESGNWTCAFCTFSNEPSSSKCEVCEVAPHSPKILRGPSLDEELEKEKKEEEGQEEKNKEEEEKEKVLVSKWTEYCESRSGRVPHRHFIQVPRHLIGYVVGNKCHHLKNIVSQCSRNCTAYTIPTELAGDEVSAIVIESKKIEDVFACEDALLSRLVQMKFPSVTNSEKVKKKVQQLPPVPSALVSEERRFVHVDNSNVMHGCQQITMDKKDYRIRLNVRALAELLKGKSKRVIQSVVVGSKPIASSKIWRNWEAAGYRALVGQRDQDTGKEVLVDSALQALMYACIFSRYQKNEPAGSNTLVLATGDGNDNGGLEGNNFPACVDLAASRGWRVEVWSWKFTRNRVYSSLVKKWPKHVKLCDLDDYRRQITYEVRSSQLPGAPPQNKNVPPVQNPNGPYRSLPPKSKSVVQQRISISSGPNAGLSKPNDEDEEDDVCPICLDRSFAFAALPCGHALVCEVCMNPRPTFCFTCSQPIAGFKSLPQQQSFDSF